LNATRKRILDFAGRYHRSVEGLGMVRRTGAPSLMWGPIASLAFVAAAGFALWTRDSRA